MPYNIGMENTNLTNTDSITVNQAENPLDAYHYNIDALKSNLKLSSNVNPSTLGVPLYGGFDLKERETYEFKLVDGTKVIQDLCYEDIVELKEISVELPNEQPKRAVQLTIGTRTGGTKTFTIDCGISMFMRIIGREYKPWAKALMTESVKNGTETN